LFFYSQNNMAEDQLLPDNKQTRLKQNKGIVFISLVVFLPLLLATVALGIRGWVENRYGKFLYDDLAKTPNSPVAIILGAGIRNNRPSPMLADRIEAGVELYKAGKVQKLLMTGDNRFINYNEPGVMAEYAMELGVPKDAIVLDYAGRRTYDSCYRAGHIFGIQQAIIISQRFHLARALFLCNHMGIEAVGFAADRHEYPSQERFLWLREVAATLVSVWDVFIAKPLPVLGDPIPILGLD
jgi:SanA protein